MPVEQSGFRSRCLLLTKVLPVYQVIKKNCITGNVPTLASIYVDCQKAYDRVWHAVLLTKRYKLGLPHSMLKMIIFLVKN